MDLNDGHKFPQIGFGTWPMNDHEAEQAVLTAVEAGYRLFDTAANYRNEKGTGAGLRNSSVPRSELFVTTKLPGRHHGYEATLKSFSQSLDNLGLDFVDLYLIHWPLPQKDLYVDSWKAMIKLRDEGRVRSIGVSNFKSHHIDRLIDETGVTPAVNQIQLHPAVPQLETRAYDQQHDIITEAWSPLGQGANDLFAENQAVTGEAALKNIADKHNKTPSQVILRWHIDNGVVPIPKSANPQRQVENIDIFDFSLDAEDMEMIAGFDRGPDAAVDSDTHFEE